MAIVLGVLSGWVTSPDTAVLAESSEWDDLSALALADDLSEDW
jgi:hypothetical protein